MQPETFRAAPSAYLALCGPWLVIGALWAYVSLQTGRVQYGPIAICLALAALFAMWLGSFRLVLAAESFAYRSLFQGEHEARYADVTGILVSQERVSRLPVRGRIELGAGRALEINWKVFSAEAVRAFHERLPVVPGRPVPAGRTGP